MSARSSRMGIAHRSAEMDFIDHFRRDSNEAISATKDPIR
jgi:hypothetical protein